MAKQFRIIATDVDLRKLQALLLEWGEVDILSSSPQSNSNLLHPLKNLELPIDEAGKTSLFCYLAPRGQPRNLSIERLSPVKIHVDLDKSELIEFWRPYYNGETIRSGRLCFQDKRHEAGCVFEKNPQFCAWANRTMAFIKKNLKRNPQYSAYIGSDAEILIQTNQIIIG